MRTFSRRDMAYLSLGGLAAFVTPSAARAAVPCVAGNLQPFLPTSLHVDCASHANFQLFRQYSTYMGLAGVVCMNGCAGQSGTYAAGNLLLYPYLKDNAKALRKSSLTASVPTGGSSQVLAKPIPNPYLPPDEYLCRVVLKAPYKDFIGFTVETPQAAALPRLSWYSDVAGLADHGAPVGVDWTSANLNAAWFGGSTDIPGQDVCNGAAWRALIVAGLVQASAPAC